MLAPFGRESLERSGPAQVRWKFSGNYDESALVSPRIFRLWPNDQLQKRALSRKRLNHAICASGVASIKPAIFRARSPSSFALPLVAPLIRCPRRPAWRRGRGDGTNGGEEILAERIPGK